MLDTRKRVSTPRMLLLSDVFVLRAPRSSKTHFLHCSSADPSQSVSKTPFFRRTMTREECYYTTFSLDPLFVSEGPSLSRHPFTVMRQGAQPCLEMTGVALIGRRWADRQCRDRTVTVVHAPLAHPAPVHAAQMIKVWVQKARISVVVKLSATFASSALSWILVRTVVFFFVLLLSAQRVRESASCVLVVLCCRSASFVPRTRT